MYMLDDLLDKIPNHYIHGIVGMSLRWFLFSLPLFAVLHYYGVSNFFSSFGLLTIGPLYYIGGQIKHKYHANAIEFLSGVITGLLITI